MMVRISKWCPLILCPPIAGSDQRLEAQQRHAVAVGLQDVANHLVRYGALDGRPEEHVSQLQRGKGGDWSQDGSEWCAAGVVAEQACRRAQGTRVGPGQQQPRALVSPTPRTWFWQASVIRMRRGLGSMMPALRSTASSTRSATISGTCRWGCADVL